MPLISPGMQEPAIPPDEAERLAALYDYGILDSPAERIFDEVAQLAATICGTEIGAVTLIDRDRQWFKAQHGRFFGETSRRESICGHAILEKELFVVPDTARDERFVDNPLLFGTPEIRFYGGSQLVADGGHAIGMLCVMDSKPRELTTAQRQALSQLANVLMAVIDAGRKTRLAHWFGTLLDNVQDEILIIDPDSLMYLHANRAAQEHLGFSLEEMRRLTPMDVTGDRNHAKFEGYVARLRAGEPFVTFDGVRCRSDAATYPVEARWQLLTAGAGTVILSIVQDVSERNRIERMKEEFITSVSGELELARSMQRGLLPAPAEKMGLRVAWFFQASSFVGGDSFDYLAIDERHLAFYMLDVAGHGVAAAMMAMSAQHQLYGLARREGRAMLAQGRSVAETASAVMSEYNRQTAQLKDSDLYVTVGFGIYDSHERRAAIVQAGHPPALVACGPAGRFEPVGEGGVPVGILPEAEYEAHALDLPRGSRVVLYSDGVVEAINARTAMYGEDRLRAFLDSVRDEPVADVARLLGEELAAWRGGEAFEDDVSVLVLEVA
jgi:PAS domain S-box-containing protein